MDINVYLNFPGTCAEAFKFYAQVLGGKIEAMVTFGEMPGEYPVAPEMKDKVLHVKMSAEGQYLMGSDAPPERYEKVGGMSVSVNTPDVDRAGKVFAALSEGGKVEMPFQK